MTAKEAMKRYLKGDETVVSEAVALGVKELNGLLKSLDTISRRSVSAQRLASAIRSKAAE